MPVPIVALHLFQVPGGKKTLDWIRSLFPYYGGTQKKERKKQLSCPSAMAAWKLWCAFLGGKRAALVQPYPSVFCSFFPCHACSIFVFPYISLAVRPTLLSQMNMGSLTCAQIWVHAIHTRGVWHKQVCTRVDSEGQKNCSSPFPRHGIEPRVFGLEFSLHALFSGMGQALIQGLMRV